MFEYEKIWGLKQFNGAHPKVMENWVKENNNNINLPGLKMRHEWKNVGLAISDCIEAITGHRLGEYKNYKLF